MNYHTARSTLTASGLAAVVLASGSAHAALQGRNMDGDAATFEAYYDTVLDITWLADANYAFTSGYHVNGRMDWANANTWVANLSFFNPLTNQNYTDWRLPTVEPVNGASFNYSFSYNGSTDRGYNVSEQDTLYAGATSSEMAHLFYNTLNNKGFCDSVLSTASSCPSPTTDWGLTNAGPFTNLQDGYYWSEPEYAPNPSQAWSFFFRYGEQVSIGKTSNVYALAVSPGDIATVPEAETYALMLVGLGLIGWRARQRG